MIVSEEFSTAFCCWLWE